MFLQLMQNKLNNLQKVQHGVKSVNKKSRHLQSFFLCVFSNVPCNKDPWSWSEETQKKTSVHVLLFLLCLIKIIENVVTYLKDTETWSPGAQRVAVYSRWLQSVGCTLLFLLFPAFFFSSKHAWRSSFLFGLQWESASSLHMTSHSPPSVSSVFQPALLFGLVAQRGDQGLNIDSRGESPCVLKEFCLSALLSSRPPRSLSTPCCLSQAVGFCFWPKYLKEVSPHAVSKFFLLWSKEVKWGEGKTGFKLVTSNSHKTLLNYN